MTAVADPVSLACMGLLATATATDLLRRIVPNSLTLSGALAGLAYHLWMARAWEGFALAAGGLTLGALLLLGPYLMGWTGGGDVKLMACMGAWLGPDGAVHLFFYSTVAGGIIAAVQVIRHRCSNGACISAPSAAEPLTGIPYALAIASGYAGLLAWGPLC